MCYESKRREEMWCCASILAFFCPPLSVLLMTGCSVDFLLNCLLTFLLFIPGFIHAQCIIYCPERIDPNAKLQMTEVAVRRRERAELEAQARAQQAQAQPEAETEAPVQVQSSA